jgi:hypothetical protein
MFMQGLHIKMCGLIQCEVDPAIYHRIEEEKSMDDKRIVKNFIIVITWVDDVRYFGEQFVKEYEEAVSKNCKCKMEGESNEFVSIKIKQDLQNKTLEFTQNQYWVKAIERFAEFLPNCKAKDRRVPLSAIFQALQEYNEVSLSPSCPVSRKHRHGIVNFRFSESTWVLHNSQQVWEGQMLCFFYFLITRLC